jgi:lipopolysaccharide transport system ATP-binding protein
VTLVAAAPAVTLDGVGKRYLVNRSRAPRRLLGGSTGRRERPAPPAPDLGRDFWALRDVTFQVPAGKIMAVIGRNGSGKTTLMKLIARITAPTEGTIVVRGRVGSMLRVGTGFHPELTGRDNIALSGAILGMTKQEIDAVEDEIIDFAEIGRFIDSPVKHYSSGMNVRLAFGVSSYMPGDVMIIDEALAVGDAVFQKKCQDRIAWVVRQGRTVLFVSHSMPSVLELCDVGVVLDGGRIRFDGTVEDAVTFYESDILRGARPEPGRRGGDARRARAGAATIDDALGGEPDGAADDEATPVRRREVRHTDPGVDGTGAW